MVLRSDSLGYNRVALYIAALFLLLSSFYVELMPAEGLSLSVSVVLGLVADILLLTTVYITSGSLLHKPSERMLAVVLSAAFLMAADGAVCINRIHIAAIALLWAQFCLLKEQYFTAFFMMALSAMFFPPVIWIALLVIILMLTAGLTDKFRNILKFLGGLLTPYVLLFSGLYLFGHNVFNHVCKYWAAVSEVNYISLSGSISSLFLVLCLLLITVHAIIMFSIRMKEYGIAQSYALKMQIINVLVCIVEFFLFAASSKYPVAVLGACPLGILLARYFSRYGRQPLVRAEMIILLCALVLYRLGYFIV